MDVRVNLVGVHGTTLVQQKVACEQHVQAELRPLALKASVGDLPGKTTEASTRYQHLDQVSVVRVEGGESIQQRTVALRPLLLSRAGPVANWRRTFLIKLLNEEKLKLLYHYLFV